MLSFYLVAVCSLFCSILACSAPFHSLPLQHGQAFSIGVGIIFHVFVLVCSLVFCSVLKGSARPGFAVISANDLFRSVLLCSVRVSWAWVCSVFEQTNHLVFGPGQFSSAPCQSCMYCCALWCLGLLCSGLFYSALLAFHTLRSILPLRAALFRFLPLWSMALRPPLVCCAAS